MIVEVPTLIRPIAAVLVPILLSSCPADPRPPPAARIWELTDSGFVEIVEGTEAGDMRITLEGGETIDLPRAFNNGGGGIEPGELLLVGTSPAGNLAYRTLNAYDGCYSMDDAAIDDGSHILFAEGFRLPKAPGFEPQLFLNGDFPSYEDWCINEDGEVVRVDI